MTKEFMLSDLREAKEELDKMIAEIDRDTDFDPDGYYVSFQHVYHHLNFAWNSRNEPDSRIGMCTDEDFRKWGIFPGGFDMAT